MTLADLNDRQAVLDAIKECDALGRMAFLSKYGFKPARLYFLRAHGRNYDTKAIAGVAHGYQFPEAEPLEWSRFSDGELTVARKLRSLGFPVSRDSIQDTIQPIVLVENELTEGGKYDHWKDVTGELYHFPNQYRNKVTEGGIFLYYRGVRRKNGRRGTPEYFGWGRIGFVSRDEDIPEENPKAQWKWFAEITDYQPFSSPVPAKIDGQPFESIPEDENRRWGVAVRSITKETLDRVLKFADVRSSDSVYELGIGIVSAPIDLVKVRFTMAGENLLVSRKPRSDNERSPKAGRRRSPFSNAIGKRAEKVIYHSLRSTLPLSLRESVRWVSEEGETPGWDIEYFGNDGAIHAVEVKGTQGSAFPNIEFTANEWRQAEVLRGQYSLFLVSMCLIAEPVVQVIEDPFGAFLIGELSASPLAWRLEQVTK